MSPKFQILAQTLHTYIKTYAISIIVRYNYLHGARSTSGELIGNLVKGFLG